MLETFWRSSIKQHRGFSSHWLLFFFCVCGWHYRCLYQGRTKRFRLQSSVWVFLEAAFKKFFFFSFIFQDHCNNWLVFFSVSESTHTVYASFRNDHLLQSRTLSTENIVKHQEDDDWSLLLFVQSFLMRHVDPCDLQTSSPASVLLRGRTHILKSCCVAITRIHYVK